MGDEMSPEKAFTGKMGVSVAKIIVMVLTVGCVWFLMTVYAEPPPLAPLLFVVVTFIVAMYFIKHVHPLTGVLLWGARTLPMCLFAAPTMDVEKARELTALATATSIESAVDNFYSEYGSLPDVGGRVRTGSKEGFKLLAILLGRGENPPKFENKRGIRFLPLKEGKNYKRGLMFDSGGNLPDGLFDPWGNPYVVFLDQDYEGKLHFNHGAKTVDLPEKRVAVFSPGKDGIEGNSDDVKTWGN